MKKLSIVLISLFTLSFVGLHAQETLTQADTLMIVSSSKRIVVKEPKVVPGRGFAKSLEVAASVLPSPKNFDVSVVMITGYRFNKFVFLGGGIGVSYLQGDTWGYYDDEDPNRLVGIPVFLRAKFNFTKTKVSPYFGVDLGGAMLWNNDNYLEGALIFRPHIGLDINVSDKIKPYIMVGGSTYGGALFFGAGCKF